MNVGTREAVLGIAECCVVTRILDIPSVPANELRTVIEGELAHYQILGNSTGAFDYMPLVAREGEAETGPQALVMAAEVAIVMGYGRSPSWLACTSSRWSPHSSPYTAPDSPPSTPRTRACVSRSAETRPR